MRWSRFSLLLAKKILAYSRFLISLSEHRDDIPTVTVNGVGEKRRSKRLSSNLAPPQLGSHEYHSDSEVNENIGNQSPRSPDHNSPDADETATNYDSFKRTTLGKQKIFKIISKCG